MFSCNSKSQCKISLPGIFISNFLDFQPIELVYLFYTFHISQEIIPLLAGLDDELPVFISCADSYSVLPGIMQSSGVSHNLTTYSQIRR